jgi:hypothetical protein
MEEQLNIYKIQVNKYSLKQEGNTDEDRCFCYSGIIDRVMSSLFNFDERFLQLQLKHRV